MSEKNPTRRDLMRPVQLLGFALLAAVFAGVVTLVSMGVLQDQRPGSDVDQHLRAWAVAGIVTGITFIATLVIMALSLLAVDPAQMAKPVERGLLLDAEDESTPGEGDAGRHPAPPSGH
ncbi:hypothetical protein [Microbacterium sp. 77mftsu3.1]|uniref:hypothetical protein n=1 Tax=Microbacterium sp. 77mftsu3.1 TaxID=1761802 RepID=UPI0003677E60|nr:hypothetical protein [Microbacterium sp. 77mftsu3.1]SDG61457.1 hypothetical protein SAMN04488590_1290 [Microbacterium sp. 77mftsu3.1]